MKRCVRCLMPETARNIDFDEKGVCLACQRSERKVDYVERKKELTDLCNRYRHIGGGYDCIIPISGGKDSFVQVDFIKNSMDMSPLLLCVTDEFSHTQVGQHNNHQLAESFRCDTITLRLNPELVRETTRWGFERNGSTNWAVDMAIYTWPLKMAFNLDIPFVIYGENVEWEYGCKTGVDEWSAKRQILNNVVNIKDVPPLDPHESTCIEYPSDAEIYMIEPIYLSYFTGWDGMYNAKKARTFGFRSLEGEWKRQGYIDNFWQIDSVGYLMNYYLKYAKYGYSKAIDVASHLIRKGYITRDEGIELVKYEEGKLDQRVLDDFLKFTGYTDMQFWSIMGKWFNKDLFEYKCNEWQLKDEHKIS